MAFFKNDFRGAGNGYDVPPFSIVKDSVIFRIGIERQFVQKREFPFKLIFRKADLLSEYMKRRFGRVSGDAPARIFFGKNRPGIRGERRYPRRALKRQVFGNYGGVPSRTHSAAWLIPDAAYLEQETAQIRLPNDYFVLRQCARFIDGDNARLAERFDCLQPLDQCIPFAHPPYAGDKNDGQHERQPFRYDGNGERDRGREHPLDRISDSDAEHEQESAYADDRSA